MKNVVRITESELTRIVRKVMNENEFEYGHENIKKLYDKLGDDEHVSLDDSSGELSGTIVKKKDYINRMLKSAIREKNWKKVEQVISFIDIKM